jgi:hypothetical protein
MVNHHAHSCLPRGKRVQVSTIGLHTRSGHDGRKIRVLAKNRDPAVSLPDSAISGYNTLYWT